MSTVCTTAATTFPLTDSPAAAHTARNSRDASAAPYVAPSRLDEPRLSTQMTVAEGGQRVQEIRASAYLRGWESDDQLHRAQPGPGHDPVRPITCLGDAACRSAVQRPARPRLPPGLARR